MVDQKTIREPLFHVTKRTEISLTRQIFSRVIAVIVGLVVCCLICLIFFGGKANPIVVIGNLFKGNFGTERKRWILLRDMALLLGVGIALIPAYKMKFWNLGGNGQILIGALVTIWVMKDLGGKLPDGITWIIMLLAAMICAAAWAVIPAIFKAFFKTNESLFTLMMNYIATGLVAYAIKVWCGEKGSGSLPPVQTGNLPQIGGEDYLLIIIVVAILCAFMYVYMKYTKHGFEVSLVGESENTARYIGINVNKTIIRTLILSGALCGVIGFLIAGAKDHTITSASAKNLGFTAIIVIWMAKMNPLASIATAFGVIFITNGMNQVQMVVGVTDSSVSEMIVGIMYFCLIGCEFFINYVINRKSKKQRDALTTGKANKEA